MKKNFIERSRFAFSSRWARVITVCPIAPSVLRLRRSRLSSAGLYPPPLGEVYALRMFSTEQDRLKSHRKLDSSVGPWKANWLFIGHPEAGERSAVIYTLLGSCRRHGITPFE